MIHTCKCREICTADSAETSNSKEGLQNILIIGSSGVNFNLQHALTMKTLQHHSNSYSLSLKVLRCSTWLKTSVEGLDRLQLFRIRSGLSKRLEPAAMVAFCRNNVQSEA